MYPEVVLQNYSASQIFSQLYEDEIRIYAAAIKICHIQR